MTGTRLLSVFPGLVDAARSVLGRDFLSQLLGEGTADDPEFLAKVNLALQGQGSSLRIADVAKVTPVLDRPWGVVAAGADRGTRPN